MNECEQVLSYICNTIDFIDVHVKLNLYMPFHVPSLYLPQRSGGGYTGILMAVIYREQFVRRNTPTVFKVQS